MTNNAGAAYVKHLNACSVCRVARSHDLLSQCGQPVARPVDYCGVGATLHAVYLNVTVVRPT